MLSLTQILSQIMGLVNTTGGESGCFFEAALHCLTHQPGGTRLLARFKQRKTIPYEQPLPEAT